MKEFKNWHDIQDWAKENGRALMVTIFLLLIGIVNFGGYMADFMNSHHGYKY